MVRRLASHHITEILSQKKRFFKNSAQKSASQVLTLPRKRRSNDFWWGCRSWD